MKDIGQVISDVEEQGYRVTLIPRTSEFVELPFLYAEAENDCVNLCTAYESVAVTLRICDTQRLPISTDDDCQKWLQLILPLYLQFAQSRERNELVNEIACGYVGERRRARCSAKIEWRGFALLNERQERMSRYLEHEIEIPYPVRVALAQILAIRICEDFR